MKVRYKDVALGADKDATVTTTGKMAFSDVSMIPYGVNPPALATCELNGWGLSRQYIARGNQTIAFWSNTLSGDDCIFAETPIITLDFDNQYTTTGLTIQFAVNSFDFCRKIAVTWYQGEEIKATEESTPDSPLFVLNKTVEAFDKIVIEFKETNLPRKRCKIEGIIIGVVRDFDGKELKAVKAIHEIDLISNTVPVNVLDASIHGSDEVDYIFQKKQPVEAYDKGNLIGVYYIDKGERTGKFDFSFSCKDAIGLLDLVPFNGGLWLSDTPLKDVLYQIFGDTFEFDIAPDFANAKIRGYIPPNIKQREALQHIAFSIGAIVDTSGTNKIRIFPAPVGAGVQIPTKETYIGGKVATSDTVTGVKVKAFDIENVRPAENDESIEIDGVKYKVTTTEYSVTNPNTVASDFENVKVYDKCYLVNSSNGERLAYSIMNYYQKRNKYSFKHILNGQNASGKYTASLPWGDDVSGHITKMTVTTSNITVSDTEMLIDG